jgi:hypothetical protein
VRQHQAAGVQLGLELAAVLAGLDGDGQGDLIDFDHSIKRSQVDDDPAVNRQRTTLRARAAAPWHHRDVVLVGDREHGGDFLFGPWPYDGVRASDRRSSGLCGQCRPVRVGGVLRKFVRCRYIRLRS